MTLLFFYHISCLEKSQKKFILSANIFNIFEFNINRKLNFFICVFLSLFFGML